MTQLLDNNLCGEHREHRELINDNNTLECSQTPSATENSDNKVPALTSPPTADNISRPSFATYYDTFFLDKEQKPAGLYWHGTDKHNKPVDYRVANVIEIKAMSSDLTGHNFGRLLEFRDTDGELRQFRMPMKLLKGSGDEILGELLDQGFTYDRKHANKLIEHLMSSHSPNKVVVTNRVGWQGTDAFVLPQSCIGNSEVMLQSDSVHHQEYESRGGLDEWCHHLGKYCSSNPSLMFTVCAALAGPLLHLLNRQQGAGIHWMGDSSSGKSTCIEVAASVWGPPEFMRSWSTTANGLEGIAAMRNDTCLILDEIDEASPLEISKIVYMLANGQGKQRSNRVGSARKIQRWRTIVLSTGERSLTSIMSDINKQPNSGQLVRLLNINASFEHGIFSELHQFHNGKELSDHLKSARTAYYGTLGPKFIEELIKNPSALHTVQEKLRIADTFAENTKHGIEKRAAATCELIATAGELAIYLDMLPWEQETPTNAALEMFNRWKNDNSQGNTEDERILYSVQRFINQYGSSRFEKHPPDSFEKTIPNRAGWRKDDSDSVVYMFHSDGLIEAGGKFTATRIAQALKRDGCIVDHNPGRLTHKTRIGSEHKNLYHIRIQSETTHE